MAEERRYLAYMVRLWAVQRNGDMVWRASAENAHTGERHAFADVAALIDYLQAAVAEELPPPEKMESSYKEI